MERQYAIDNARERERLRNLVNGMTNEELTYILYDEGWTIGRVGPSGVWRPADAGDAAKMGENRCDRRASYRH